MYSHDEKMTVLRYLTLLCLQALPFKRERNPDRQQISCVGVNHCGRVELSWLPMIYLCAHAVKRVLVTSTYKMLLKHLKILC